MRKREDAPDITVFLMGDAVVSARAGQKTPDGYYNLERMLRTFLNRGGAVSACGTCMDARGLTEEDLLPACRRSTMDELAQATLAADTVLTF